MSVLPKRRLQRIAATFNAKARKHHAPGVVTWEMLASMPAFCRYCGIGLELDHGSWDHYVAFDRGGHNWVTNIVRCCIRCQREKHTKSEEEFAEHQDLTVVCARPECGNAFKPRWAEYKRGMARFCSHTCAGMAKGKNW